MRTRFRNLNDRPLFIDSSVRIEIHSSRPPMAGHYERLMEGDVLEVLVEYPVEIGVKGDTLVIRAYNPEELRT